MHLHAHPGGRQGRQDDPGLGSTAENLLRLCPCDLLLTTRLERPEPDLRAEQSLRWTPEAEERMKRVPRQFRGVARVAIHRLAVEKGHSMITSDLLEEAIDRYPSQVEYRLDWCDLAYQLERREEAREALLAVERRGLPISRYQRARLNRLRLAAGLEPIRFLD